ncbi:MAG: hypothetical protein CSB49_05655 [Proteobacteria bacterium]|nr:MAG: hypothetical protein CSB49_05655 [Pseudomonadota bacterium]
MQRSIATLVVEGGFWMYPLALAGLAGIGLAASNARRDLAKWAIWALLLCLVLSMVGAYSGASFALKYIAAGAKGQTFWMPLTMSALGMNPPYLAAILMAIGSGVLGLTSAYRKRNDRLQAMTSLVDGFLGSSLLVCVVVVVSLVPEMLMATSTAARPNEAHVVAAKAMATRTQDVIGPASLALALLVVRAALSRTRRSNANGES